MKVTRPECGHVIEIRHLGRPPLNVTFTNVCDALQRAKNVRAAATELQVSPAYIYRVLKSNQLSIKDVLEAAQGRHLPTDVVDSCETPRSATA